MNTPHQDEVHTRTLLAERFPPKAPIPPKAPNGSGQDDLHDPNYQPLRELLDAAYDRAARGKGAQRHAGSRPFMEQPIMRILSRHGEGFAFGQIEKKLQEAERMDAEAAVREYADALVYLAAVILHRTDGKAGEIYKRKEQ